MPLFGPPNVEKMKAKRDTKGLIKALGYGRDAAVPRDVAKALGELGDPQAVAPLVGALASSEGQLRGAAAKALEQIGRPAVERLISALDSASPHVRRFAASTLGEIGDSRAAAPLIVALNDDDSIVRENAIGALVRLGDSRVVPLLTGILANPAEASGVRWSAAQGLGQMGAKEAVAPLVAALAGDDRLVRASAAEALGAIGDARAVDGLVAALSDGDHSVRVDAAEALGRMRAKSATKALIAVVQDEVVGVRRKAAWALGRIGDPRATEGLARALRDPARGVRDSAGRALSALGTPALETLVAGLLDADAGVSAVAAQALERMGWKLDTKGVRTPSRREQAKWDLCARIGKPAVAPVAAALRGRDWPARARAAKTLGRIGDARAVKRLVPALKDADFHVRTAAAGALGALGWEAGRTGSGAAYWIAKGEWAECVEIGAPAVKPLLAALRYTTGHSRAQAASALVEIYQSGTLSGAQKQAILAQRHRITASGTHRDGQRHFDAGQPSCHQDYEGHDDTGTRVDFPL